MTRFEKVVAAAQRVNCDVECVEVEEALGEKIDTMTIPEITAYIKRGEFYVGEL